MPAYEITYKRDDMPNECKAVKYTNTEKEALKLLQASFRRGVHAYDFKIKKLEDAF